MKCVLSLRKSQHVQNLFQQGVAIPGTLVGITNISGEWSSNILQAALQIASLSDEMYVLPISNDKEVIVTSCNGLTDSLTLALEIASHEV